MFVSVVIPTFGRREGLLRLVGQLLAQETDGVGYEIVVVDDGSPEPVGPSLESRFTTPPVQLRCLRKPNGGPAAARNYGAAHAQGELLLFVDDDMAVRPDFVQAHISTQEEFGPALVNADFVWEVAGHPVSFGRWYQARVEVWNRARESRTEKFGDRVFAIPHINVTTANLSVPRSIFEQVGGFDTGYPFGCEDQDFALRLELLGYPAVMTTRTTATHVELNNTFRKLCRRQERGSADTVRFIKRFAFNARFGRQAIAVANDPAYFGRDPWRLVFKQWVKRLLASRVGSPVGFATLYLLETIAPQSRMVPRLYELLVSAYILKGWSEGLRRYAHEVLLPDFVKTVAGESLPNGGGALTPQPPSKQESTTAN